MRNKNKCLETGFFGLLLTVGLVLFSSTRCSAYPGILTVGSGETVDLGNDYLPDYGGVDGGWADVYGTLNMYTGAYVDGGIYAFSGSTVNIYAGTIGLLSWIDVAAGATVTVYGTNFLVSSGTIGADGSWTPDVSGTLTGKYENGTDIDLLFFSDVPVYLKAPPGTGPIEVDIDIKPGTDPNPINPGANGVIPVAILTDGDFDAATVDPATVTLAGAGVAIRGKSEKLLARLEDVDDDGDLDLLLQVDTQSDDAVWEAGEVILSGRTYQKSDSEDIQGSDYVVIMPEEE